MLITRRELPVVVVNLVYISVFTIVAFQGRNYEFVLYAGVVIALAAWILWKQQKVRFDALILWGLTAWGLLHMCGGNLRVGGEVLYNLQLIPIVLRYDQFVHAVGFGTATLVCHHLLWPYLRPDIPPWWPLAVLIVLMGSGLGAVNEIVEYIAVRAVPETNVGGYENTLWDLIFNLFGGIIAVVWLSVRRQAS